MFSLITLEQLKRLSVHGKAYRLNLLDTAGQERFRTLSNSYYRGAHGVILVYDISNRESFLAMEKWYNEAESNAMPGAVMYLVCVVFYKYYFPIS
jgi:Ras-related protein Rab-18